MMRVSNHKAIQRLAWRSFKANRMRNIFAIIAMILTTILFTSLFTAAVGMKNTAEQMLMRQYGTSSHGNLMFLSKEQVKQLSVNPLIKKYGTNLYLSFLINDNFAVRNAEIGYYDENAAKMSYCTPTTGRLPKDKNELATETAVLNKLGIAPKLGEEVTITYPFGTETVTQTFKLCGYLESDKLIPSSKILLSEAYVEEQLENYQQKEQYDYIGAWKLQLMLDNSLNIARDSRTIAEENGYQVDDATKENYIYMDVNRAYLSAQRARDYSLPLIVTVVSLLILFTGYLIIYNIFLISITSDIRFYGLLKTIGTTGRQIKRIIRYQAILLSIIGMPIGLLIGYFIGSGVTPLFMSSMNNASYQKMDPIIFIGAALFTILTVLISIRKPGKAAAKVSPVEAVRYTETSKKRKRITKKSKHGARIYRMALSNLSRNKKKTILVVISLSLSVILLNLVYVFSKGFDMDKLIAQMTVADYTIGSTNYFERDYRAEEDGVSEKLISEVNQQKGIQDSGRVYYDTNPAVVEFTQKMIDYYFRGMPEEEINDILSIYQISGDETKRYQIQLYGMDDFILGKMKVAEGSLDLDKFKTGDYIIQVVETNDYNEPDWNPIEYRVGDMVTVNYIEEATSDKSEMKYHSKTYEVMAVVEAGVGWNVRYYNSTAMILPSDHFMKDTGINTTMAYFADVEDASEASMEQFLKDNTDNISSDMSYESKTTLIGMFTKYRDAFVIVGNVLSILVGIVGILNSTNVMMTGIVTRKREFASLKSIGMSGKQLITMLIIEGLFYTVITILISTMGSTLLNLTLIKSISDMIWFFTARFTLLPVIVVTPILLFVSVVVPYLSYRVSNKQSIVEQLRVLE